MLERDWPGWLTAWQTNRQTDYNTSLPLAGEVNRTDQADEAAAADGIALAQLGSEESEVKMLQQQQHGCEQHPWRQKDERAGEIEDTQRLARLTLSIVLLTRSSHPEPL